MWYGTRYGYTSNIGRGRVNGGGGVWALAVVGTAAIVAPYAQHNACGSIECTVWGHTDYRQH